MKLPVMCRNKGRMFEILGSISTQPMMLKNALHILELIQTPERTSQKQGSEQHKEKLEKLKRWMG